MAPAKSRRAPSAGGSGACCFGSDIRGNGTGEGVLCYDARIPRGARPTPMHATLPLLARSDFPALRRNALEIVQVNVGYVCNQSCLHCHVNAGPTRTESMSLETAEQVLAYLASSGATA